MLLDHFHPPLASRRGWKGFHLQWASNLASELNRRLPPGWFAEPDVRFGIEVDVGVVNEDSTVASSFQERAAWTPAPPTLTLDLSLATDQIEVAVFNYSYSPSLVAAIELVSPANKDRPEARDVFVSKCETILSEGAGLIIVDLVTERHFNLHAELLNRLGSDSLLESNLYTAAYHPARGGNDAQSRLEVWEEPLELGGRLPVLPLFLRVGPMLPVNLNATYDETCQQLRISSSESISPSTT